MASNTIHQNVQALLQKEMTRKQFFVTLFSILLGTIGLSAVLGAMTHYSPSSANPGYGEKKYGP